MKTMKNKKIFLSVFWMLLLVWGCSAGSQNNIGSENNKGENSEKQDHDKNWQQVLAEKTPLDKDELYKLFPEKLGEFPLILISDNPGTNGAIGSYCHESETSNLNRHITLTIIDGAGYTGFQHINEVHRMLESNYSEKNEKEWLRIEKLNNQKMIFRDKTSDDWAVSGISFLKNLRYHVTLSANRISTNDLRNPVNEIQALKFPE